MSSGVVYPARYDAPNLPVTRFERLLDAALAPGLQILDVGSGNDPALDIGRRPIGTQYAGLDVSRTELERAPAGSYDEIWVTDAATRVQDLEGRFDLIVSFQVLEHVKPLDVALENIRSYLKPGGTFLAILSGGWVYFALLNRLLPRQLKLALLRRSTPELNLDDIFPAPYHHCSARALRRDLREWSEVELLPFHAGAGYLERMSRPLCRAYLAIESWFERSGHDAFASNYIIRAVR